MENPGAGEGSGIEARGATPRGGRRILAIVLGTGFGAGFFPAAPGTAGTLLVGLPLAWALGSLAPWAGIVGAGVLFVAGLRVGGDCERILGRPDPPQVVLDEVAGMLVAVLWLAPSWRTLLAGFVLFRLFDIWKPWPASRAERLRGGLGIMLDDVVAGLYARAALEVGLRLLSAWGQGSAG
jgi:phosphatidylglycerophosphatase A